MRFLTGPEGGKLSPKYMGLNMDSQNLASDNSPAEPINDHQSDTLDEALLLLSRSFGRQLALDFMRDPDILTEGVSE